MERITFSISFILWRKVSKVPKKGVARCLEPLIHPPRVYHGCIFVYYS